MQIYHVYVSKKALQNSLPKIYKYESKAWNDLNH